MTIEPNSVRDFDVLKVKMKTSIGIIPEFQCCVLVMMTDGILSKYGVTVFTRPGTGSWTITD